MTFCMRINGQTYTPFPYVDRIKKFISHQESVRFVFRFFDDLKPTLNLRVSKPKGGHSYALQDIWVYFWVVLCEPIRQDLEIVIIYQLLIDNRRQVFIKIDFLVLRDQNFPKKLISKLLGENDYEIQHLKFWAKFNVNLKKISKI